MKPTRRARTRTGPIVAGVLLVALAAGACAGAREAEPAPGPDRRAGATDATAAGADATAAGPDSASTGPDRPSTAELEAIYRARADSALRRYTEADVHFMTGMIVHHAQALVMSAMAPTHGAGPDLGVLAARIANSQRDEIATMERWLDERGLPVPDVEIGRTGLTVRGVPDHMRHMPGMLTPEQLRTLDAARGREFDRLFLAYMIQHHRGAVDMVHDLLETDGAAQHAATFRLASDIQADQIAEIGRMQRMLERLPAPGGS